jgi:hypothetical protein
MLDPGGQVAPNEGVPEGFRDALSLPFVRRAADVMRFLSCLLLALAAWVIPTSAGAGLCIRGSSALDACSASASDAQLSAQPEPASPLAVQAADLHSGMQRSTTASGNGLSNSHFAAADRFVTAPRADRIGRAIQFSDDDIPRSISLDGLLDPPRDC